MLRKKLALLLLGTALALACSLTGAVAALAHANLVRSEPATSSVLDASPAEVSLWFSEAPEPRFSEVRLLDGQGQSVDGLGPLQPSPTDPTELTATLQPLPDGVYTVVWRATSAVDGHTTVGSIVFVVGRDQVPTGGLRPASVGPPPSGGATPSELIARWLGYLAVALLVGGFAFYPTVLRPSLFSALAGQAATVDAAPLALPRLGVGLAVLQAASGARVGALDALDQPLSTLLFETRSGSLLLARLSLLVLIAGLLAIGGRAKAWPLGLAWWWVGFGLSTLVASTFSLGSHAAAGARPIGSTPAVSTLADWVHLVAAGTWLGGLAALGVALSRTPRLLGESGAIAARLVGHFTRLATVCVATIALTGLYQAVVEVGDLPSLVDTPYGQALVVKLVFLILTLGVAAANLLLVGPRLRQAAIAPAPPAAANPWPARIRQTVGAEALLLAAVLLATSGLTSLTPAREAYGVGVVLRGDAPDIHAVLVVNPGLAGLNTFDAYLRDSAGRPIDDALKVSLIVSSLAMKMGETEAVGQSVGGGHYFVQGGYLSMSGTWHIQILVRRPGLYDVRIQLDVVTQDRRPTFGLAAPTDSIPRSSGTRPPASARSPRLPATRG